MEASNKIRKITLPASRTDLNPKLVIRDGNNNLLAEPEVTVRGSDSQGKLWNTSISVDTFKYPALKDLESDLSFFITVSDPAGNQFSGALATKDLSGNQVTGRIDTKAPELDNLTITTNTDRATLVLEVKRACPQSK